MKRSGYKMYNSIHVNEQCMKQWILVTDCLLVQNQVSYIAQIFSAVANQFIYKLLHMIEQLYIMIIWVGVSPSTVQRRTFPLHKRVYQYPLLQVQWLAHVSTYSNSGLMYISQSRAHHTASSRALLPIEFHCSPHRIPIFLEGKRCDCITH